MKAWKRINPPMIVGGQGREASALVRTAWSLIALIFGYGAIVVGLWVGSMLR